MPMYWWLVTSGAAGPQHVGYMITANMLAEAVIVVTLIPSPSAMSSEVTFSWTPQVTLVVVAPAMRRVWLAR